MPTSQVERPPRSERKARGSGHLRRAELLAAAQRIFTEAGYEGATIRKIADEVGVSSTALYMYFQDKSQIMLEICVETLEEQKQALQAIAEQPLEPQAKVRMMLEGMLRFGFTQPTAYQLLYGEAPRDVIERRNELIAPKNRACFQIVVQAVEAAMAAGRMRADVSAKTVTDALVAACHGAVTIRLANPHAPWTDPAELSMVLIDGLFHGFGAN